MKKYLGLFVGLALLAPLAAGAAEFKTGNAVSLNETVRDNMYAVGGTVNIAGTVEGDLYVAGGTVNLMGTVTRDVVVFGGTIIITGKIGQDLRVVGGNATIGGPIGGELVAAGGNISVLPGTTIDGGAYVAGGNINFGGSVKGNLVIASDQIVLAEGLKVEGNFDYYSQKELVIKKMATGEKVSSGTTISVNGTITFHQQATREQGRVNKFPLLAFLTFWWLMGIAGMTIFACILFYAWRKDSENMISTAMAKPGRELLRGFISFFIIPIAAVMIMITVLGLPIGFMVLLSYGVFLLLSTAVSGLLAASLMAKFLFNKKETDLNWWLILLGVLVLAIIKLIPWFGWIISFLIYLVAFGVLTNKIYAKFLPEK